jgi:hypothetical protein
MATSERSPEVNLNPSMPWSGDSPARTSRKPDNVPASRDLARAFGLNMPVSLGWFDPESYLLRMSQASLLSEEQWDEWLETWPDCGMWDAGGVFELATSEPPINASECSLSQWITPVERDHGSTTITPQFPEGFNANLVNQVSTWLTPTTEDHKDDGPVALGRYESGEAMTCDQRLRNQAATWPTPVEGMAQGGVPRNTPAAYNGMFRGNTMAAAVEAFDQQKWPTPDTVNRERTPETEAKCLAFRQKSGRTTVPQFLADSAQRWPTPQATDAASAARHTTTTGVMHQGTSLTDATRMWPTPVVGDHWTPSTEESAERETDKRNLRGTAITWPTPRGEDGESCGNHPGAVDSLTGAAQMWPTPEAHAHARGPGFAAQDGHYQPHDLATATDQWPTPTEDNANNAGGPSRQNGSYQDLTVEVANWTAPTEPEMWTTPHGMSNRDQSGKVGGCGGGEFGHQTTQWRSPTVRDHHKGGPRLDADQRQLALCDQAETMWQTPATDSFRSRGDRKEEMGLDQQARSQNWITPNARDWKSETGSENNRYDKTPGLSRQVYELTPPSGAPQDPPIPAGPPSSQSVQTFPPHSQDPPAKAPERRRLNPRFVEWLMGFPISWTEL